MRTLALILALAALVLVVPRADAAPPCGPGTLGQRFVILERGTAVCDNTSGLVWERRPEQSSRTYQDAVAWCAAKGQAWQLPGIKDFFTLVDLRARPGKDLLGQHRRHGRLCMVLAIT